MRRVSAIVVVAAAAILAYGLIDAQSYHAGYVSGYSRVTRAIDAACVGGQVLDARLCADTEAALYGENGEGDGVYAAQAVDAILGTAPVAKKKNRRAKKSSVPAVVSDAVSGSADAAVPLPAPVVVPPAPVVPVVPPPPTRAQVAASFDCSKFIEPAQCGDNVDPWCKWDSFDAYGSAVTSARADGKACRDTSLRLSLISGDAQGVCAKSSIKDRLPGAYKYVGTDPVTAQQVVVCIGSNGRFAYMTAQGDMLGDPVSASEMLRVPALRTKGQSIGATAVSAPAALPTCSMAQQMPCTPPAGMMMGCQPPMHMSGSQCVAAGPREYMMADLVDIVRAFWYAR